MWTCKIYRIHFTIFTIRFILCKHSLSIAFFLNAPFKFRFVAYSIICGIYLDIRTEFMYKQRKVHIKLKNKENCTINYDWFVWFDFILLLFFQCQFVYECAYIIFHRFHSSHSFSLLCIVDVLISVYLVMDIHYINEAPKHVRHIEQLVEMSNIWYIGLMHRVCQRATHTNGRNDSTMCKEYIVIRKYY